MKKILEKYEDVWGRAKKVNSTSGVRFHRIFDRYYKRYVVMGLYDSVTHKYVLFDTINLTGNFRYSTDVVPPEVLEMEQLVASAER